VPLGLWMLEAGHVHICRLSPGGKNVVLDVLESGDLAGLASAVSGSPHETGATTADQCRLRLLPRADVFKLLHDDSESSAGIASLLAAELATAHRWIGNTTLMRSAAARVGALCVAQQSSGAGDAHSPCNCRYALACPAKPSRIFCKASKPSGALSAQRGLIAVRDRALLKRTAS
jgi:CRP-like cAMP-binding protein